MSMLAYSDWHHNSQNKVHYIYIYTYIYIYVTNPKKLHKSFSENPSKNLSLDMYVFFAFPPPPKKKMEGSHFMTPNKPDCPPSWNQTSVAQVWVALGLPGLPAKAGPGACPATWR